MRLAEGSFRLLFDHNPHPMWVYDLKTLAFLEVNEAAVRQYGYSREEFLRMTIKDIRPPEDIPRLLKEVARRKKGVNRAGVWRHRKKDGSVLEVEITSHALAFGGRRAKLVVAYDITAQRQAEREAEQRATHLRALIENSPLAIVVLDSKHRVQLCNPAFERLFGWRQKEIVGTALDEFIAPAGKEEEASGFTRRILRGEAVHATTQRRRKDGRVVEVEVHGVPLLVEGRLTGVLGLYQDITERRRAEQERARLLAQEQATRAEAQAAEQRFRDLVEGLDAIVWQADAETFQFSFVSRQAERILGYPVAQWLEERDFWVQHLHPGDREWAAALCRECAAEGRDHEFEYRMVAADGRTVWLWDNVRVVRDAVGRPRLRGVMMDVTQRVEADRALLENQIRLKILNSISTQLNAGMSVEEIIARTVQEVGGHFKGVRVAYCTIDEQGEMTVSAARPRPAGAGYRLELGRAPKVLAALERHEPVVVEEVSREARLAPLAKAFEAAGTRALLLVPLHHGERLGGSLCFESAAPRAWSDHEVATLKEVAEYLTLAIHNARAQQALRASEAKYRTLVENVYDGVFRTTPEGRLLTANPALVRMLGYESEAELLQADVRELYADPVERGVVVEKLEGDGELRNAELMLRRRDGQQIIVLENARVVRDEPGRVVYYEGTLTDITERKRAEQLQGAVYRIADAATKAATLDDLYRAVHGIIQQVMPANNFYIALYDEAEEVLRVPYFVDEVDPPPPPMKLGRGLTAYVLRTGVSLLCDLAKHEELERQGEIELVGSQSPIWLGVPLQIGEKTIGAMVVQHYTDPNAYGERERQILEYVSTQVARVIEGKLAEAALRESETKFRALTETAAAAIFISRGDRFIYVNRATEQLSGYTREELLAQDFWALIHPADRAVVRQRREARLRGEAVASRYEYRFLTKGGEERWIDFTATAIDYQGAPAVLGTAFDITERKRAEEAVRRSEAEYRSLVEGAPYGIYRARPDGRFLMVNPALAEMLGYESEAELLRHKESDLYEEPEQRARFLGESQSRERFEGVEVGWKRADGTPITVRLSGRPVRDERGEVAYLEVMAENVTEQRRLEEQLRAAQKME
ncbi:MAG: PAS domain S-box protein, partial [Acidobacteria bacterium]|nr:PAS domain S-box protein [Acidobacteriota bacterium]